MCFRTAVVLAALVLTVGPTYAAKIRIDHDASFDFTRVETFAWHEAEDTSVDGRDPLAHDRLVAMIRGHFLDSGLQEVESEPDVWITYRSITDLQLQTGAAGPAGGWYWRGGGLDETTVGDLQSNVGTLMIDVYDGSERRMIWRGTATKVLPDDPQKGYRKADAAIAKLVKKWGRLVRGLDD